MIRILKVAILLAPIFILYCSFSRNLEINSNNIEKYIKAYENIAKVSPQIKKKMQEANVEFVHLCKECYPIINKAVKDAGFKDYKHFQLFDVNMHIMISHIYKLEIAEYVGKEVSDLETDEACRNLHKIGKGFSGENSETANNEDGEESDKTKEMKERCVKVKHYSGYVKRGSKITSVLARKILDADTIKLVKSYLEKIEEVYLNEELPEGFKHVRGGGGFDD